MKIQVDTLKRKLVPVSQLFNVKYRNSDSKTDTFIMRNKMTVKTDGEIISGTCNGIPVTCNDANSLDVTAVQPAKINEIYNDCDYKETKKSIDEQARLSKEVAEVQGNTEATYGYSQMDGVDLTAEVEPLTEATQEIGLAIKTVLRAGYNRKDLVIALDEEFALDLELIDLACCDYQVQTSNRTDVLARKLGVKMVMAVPRDVLSGNFDGAVLDDTTTIKFRVYVQEYALLKDYCKSGVEIRDPKGNYVGATQVIGEYTLGYGQVDINGEAHAYYAVGTGTLVMTNLDEIENEKLLRLANAYGVDVEDVEEKDIVEELKKIKSKELTQYKKEFKTRMKNRK